MEPTSPQPYGSAPASASTSPVNTGFSTTAAHATGDTPYPADSPAQPAASGLKGKLDSALESGKKWLHDSGVAEQAQQLPQKAKDLSAKAATSISGLTNTQKVVSVGLLAAGVAFLLARGGKGKKHGKKKSGEYRDRPRKSPFDHQPSTRDGDHAYDRKGQRPFGANRYGSPAGGPARIKSGSGSNTYDGVNHGGLTDHGRPSTPRGAAAPGPRRDQGPATGSQYDAKTSGSQNPNNLG